MAGAKAGDEWRVVECGGRGKGAGQRGRGRWPAPVDGATDAGGSRDGCRCRRRWRAAPARWQSGAAGVGAREDEGGASRAVA